MQRLPWEHFSVEVTYYYCVCVKHASVADSEICLGRGGGETNDLQNLSEMMNDDLQNL